jgi:hypothetical protein
MKKLSSGSGVEIHRLINFFILETVLKDDNEKEKKYIAQLKASGSTSSDVKKSSKSTNQMMPLKLGKMLLRKGLRHERRSAANSTAW